MTNNKPGSMTMNEDKREQTSKSGQSPGKVNDPGKFVNDPQMASETVREGSKNSKGDSVRQ